ncbi:MAG: haloacid dehalogenase [Pedobacter sp.]|nr:MAG: haloacid dehalogenase [Pedobacter sp.]
MSSINLLEENETFIFDLDDVLYPEKDYLLQVYYLFAQFMEYAEQISANEVLAAMKEIFENEGHDGIFEKTAKQFNLPEKYKVNFELLMQGIRLPLKLVLFEKVLLFLNNAVTRNKKILLYISGNPEMQLNKIKQIEWHEIASHLTVYFAEELSDESGISGLEFLVKKYHLDCAVTLVVGNSESVKYAAENTKINYLSVDKLLTL